MKSKIIIWILTIIIFLIIVSNFIPDGANNITGDVTLGEPEYPKEQIKELSLVMEVIDGDTIEIDTGERVRLICVDTPERYQENYEEAKKFLEDLILNKKVRLEKDVSETDKYDRFLRYIYLNETFINELVVKEGYGKTYWYEPDTKLCPIIEDAEDYAKKNGLGIWEKDEDGDKENDKVEEVKTESNSENMTENKEENEKENSNYDCSSNVYNCGDFSSHSKAQKIFEFWGGVNNDVHRLDSDRDGVACESLR